MKTKLYSLITSLLMAACITSYGQEIVNDFTFRKPDKNFAECNLFENKDGTLLFRTLMYTPNTYEDWQHLLYKTTPEGEVLDSLIIDGSADYSYLLQNPTASNSYILTEDYWTFNEIDSLYTVNLRMVFIDANLNINNDITVPLCNVDPSVYYATWDPWFIDPQNNIIISFWTDNVHHLRRVGLDGTIITARETTELFAPNYEILPPQPDTDTTLVYSEMGFGVFSESPLVYYKLGGFKPTSGAYPIFGYFFDADFNLIGRRLYDQYSEGIAFDGANAEHITTLTDENAYLITTQITRIPQNTSGVGVAKYDMDHNPLGTSPLFGANDCFPLQTICTEDNTIYQLYVNYSQNRLVLARLDSDLNLIWNYTTPINHMFGYYYGMSWMTLLKNGDIAIGGLVRKSMRYCASFIILHDDYDNTPEMTNKDCPFIIYPNPVKDQLTLRFDDGDEPESVELYDLAGRLVGTKSNGLECIDMSAMPSGMYLLRVTMKEGTSYHEKILKE